MYIIKDLNSVQFDDAVQFDNTIQFEDVTQFRDADASAQRRGSEAEVVALSVAQDSACERRYANRVESSN